MTLAELLEKLKTADGFGLDAVAVITSSTEALRSEAKNYREARDAAHQKLGRLAEKLGTTTDGDLDAALEGKLKAAPSKSGNDELTARLARIEQELTNEKTKRTEAESKVRTGTARSSIVEALTKGKASRPADLAELLLGRAKFKEDGSPYFVDDSGAERSVEEYTGAWLKDRPELVQSSQRPGPGGPGATPPNSGKKTITEAQYNEAVATGDSAVIAEIAAGKTVVVD